MARDAEHIIRVAAAGNASAFRDSAASSEKLFFRPHRNIWRLFAIAARIAEKHVERTVRISVADRRVWATSVLKSRLAAWDLEPSPVTH